MKFYARERQPEVELRDEPDKHGLEVGRLEREGRFLISHETDPPDGRSARKKPTREAEKGSPSGSFSTGRWRSTWRGPWSSNGG